MVGRGCVVERVRQSLTRLSSALIVALGLSDCTATRLPLVLTWHVTSPVCDCACNRFRGWRYRLRGVRVLPCLPTMSSSYRVAKHAVFQRIYITQFTSPCRTMHARGSRRKRPPVAWAPPLITTRVAPRRHGPRIPRSQHFTPSGPGGGVQPHVHLSSWGAGRQPRLAAWPV
jgi:hypothetical protein